MTMLRLTIKEIGFRRANVLLSVLAVTAAVAFCVILFTTAQASQRETAKLMLSMGFNLRIIPKDTNENQFLLTGISDKTMPAEYVDKLASQKGFSYNHLLATLQKKIKWQGFEVIITGLAPEVSPPDRQKPPMQYMIEPGTVYLGYRLANQLALKKGDTIQIAGNTLTIANTLSEKGNADDFRIQCHISDAQQILNLPGQISEIKAMDCLCFAPNDDPAAILRKELASILPDAQLFQLKEIAQTRKNTRVMVKKVFSLVMPFVIIVCAVWIGILAMINVRDRKHEIGIMRALGYSSPKISTLFLGKAALVGLAGSVIGYAFGTWLTVRYGPGIFTLTAKAVKPTYQLLIWLLITAPLFAAMSSFIPAMFAVAQDPADTLREG